MSANAGLPTEKHESVKVAIIGTGSFGTAMATIAARQEHTVVMYSRDPNQVESINKHHKNNRYLTEFELLPNITATTDIRQALKDAVLIMHCIPAQATPDFIIACKDFMPNDAILCCTSKGLYLKTKQLLSEVILESCPNINLAFLSGPSFAMELMKEMPTAVVVASKPLYHAVKIQRMLSSIDFRIYSSIDIVGVQLGGALKNPLAIGAGMVEGAGLGINTLAAYVTRSSKDLQILCSAMGGDPATISGLAGIGDLMLTAFGDLSRNRQFGMRFMKGEKIEDILKDYTVEGYFTAEVAVYFAKKCGLELPVFEAIGVALQGKLKPSQLQDFLMNRPLGSER